MRAPQASERDELSRRRPDPELLGLRAELRSPGPHVRAELGLEPAGAPLARFRLVRSLQRPVPAEHVHDEPPGPGQRPERDAAATSPRSALRVDRPHLAPPPLPRDVGVVRPARRAGGLPHRPDQLLHEPQGIGHARLLGSAAGLHGRPPGPPGRSLARTALTVLRRGGAWHAAQRVVGHAGLGRQRPSRRPHRQGAGVGDEARERRDERAPTGTARRSFSPGTIGAASTITSSLRSSTARATGCACRRS